MPEPKPPSVATPAAPTPAPSTPAPPAPPAGAATEPPPDPVWLRFFQSASGPTLITVLLGGIVGALITSTVQTAMSTREKLRSEHKALVQARLDTVHQAFSLLGRMMSTAEDIIIARGPEYELAQYQGDDLTLMKNQLRQIKVDYNATDRQWRAAQYSYALLLAYYHPGRPEVPARWAAMTSAVAGFVECAREWAVTHSEPAAYDGKCDPAREHVDDAILALSNAVVGASEAGALPAPTGSP